MIWNFKSELNNPKDFLIKTELIYKREKGYNKIIDVNHYNKSLFQNKSTLYSVLFINRCSIVEPLI